MMCVDTDTDTTDSGRPPNRINIDFRSTCFDKIPLWKSWASNGRVQEAIDQLLFLEKQVRSSRDTDTAARILVAIVQIYFEAKNWLALNEQVLLLTKKRTQPKEAIMKMVQECLTYIDKIPDKDTKIKLIETLSFVTEGKIYLKRETALLIRILKKIRGEERNNPSEVSQEIPNVPLNVMATREKVIRKQRKPLDIQSKEILFNIHTYFNDLKGRDMSDISNYATNRLVSSATGIPVSSVKKVMYESKRVLEEGKPFNSAKRIRKKNIIVNDFDRSAIRQTIIDYYYDVYNEDKDFPNMTNLHQKMKSKINYTGSISSLRNEVSLLGFSWKKPEGHSALLVEKHDTRFQRINFLVKIAEYRAQGRHIVYTGETSIDTSHSSIPATRGNVLIVLHAGGMDGFIPNALYMFASTKQNIGERLHYLNSEDYIRWMDNLLIPNLKPNSIVVIDNAYYQNILQNPIPNPNACKQEMFEWLDYHNIIYSPSMLKPQLYQLILQAKDRFKEYKIDRLLRNNNHFVLRLPPYHPELNPIYKIWPMLKRGMGKKQKDSMNTDASMKLTEQQINSITQQEWKNLCDQAIKEEKKFIGHEAAVDALTERLTMNVSDSEESVVENDSAMSESE